MQTERQREAAQFRAQGAEQAQRIRAESDRQVARILGEANGAAEQIRGSADAERNRIFADAYSRDPEFFAFFRSLQAYTDSLKPSQSRFVLSPRLRVLPLPAGSERFRQRAAERHACAGRAGDVGGPPPGGPTGATRPEAEAASSPPGRAARRSPTAPSPTAQ